MNVACGTIDWDGLDEIVTGAGPGRVFGAHVRAWNYDGSGITQVPGVSFFAYSSRYGVVVSTGDVDLDGVSEILTMPGPGAANGAHLRAWNADGGSVTLVSAIDHLAYESWMTHGGKIAGGRMS